MIDRKQLLTDLKPLLKKLEADLRARCDEVPSINVDLEKEYRQARDARRTGSAFEEWRADLITQVAAAWVLSCVFVRFLEDNDLISPPRISGRLHGAGEGRGMMRARDERDVYFRAHPTATDRDYLLAVFDDLARLPGAKDIFGPHNPVSAYRHWLSGDAAQALIEFFQRIDKDGTGDLIHDFTDPVTPNGGWDTRFLGDLYQDLSEAARKKYALLQTPIFVEEFILERTLEPAISEFGLAGFKVIDPACGSGHFLLGSFERLIGHWRKQEPGTNDRELVNRALASVHGVDINPYAVAVARFRLLLAAMRECQITRLKEAPSYAFNLVCGDSLLHGSPGKEQRLLGFPDMAHVYDSEDLPELRRILTPGNYHAVVANPPYITVKDRVLNKAYRERYPEVCHMKYSLSAPFFHRIFVLAVRGGFTGQITANSFMKREFGKKLIEQYLPRIDLTHVIDTAGAYIPGHGTPTVVLLGRQRSPVLPTIRAVMGIKGEPATPNDPAQGLVWTAIIQQIDRVGSQSAFVSVSDTLREQFTKHPWSIGGGGASELKEMLDSVATTTVAEEVRSIGLIGVTGENDFYSIGTRQDAKRIGAQHTVELVEGDVVRNWSIGKTWTTHWTFDNNFDVLPFEALGRAGRLFWTWKQALNRRRRFGTPMVERGATWYEWQELYTSKFYSPVSIVFGEVSTHNHFAFDRGGKMFNRTAPVIKLGVDATPEDHLALLGLLNSSITCFWLKQGAHNKGDSTDDQGSRTTGDVAFNTYAFNSTLIGKLPLPDSCPSDLAHSIDTLATKYANTLPATVCLRAAPEGNSLKLSREQSQRLCGQMIALQEELDWQYYGLYGLIPAEQMAELRCENPPALKLGQRAFEIVLARRIAADEEESTWFTRHNSTPITEIPHEWLAEYRRVVQKRIDLIESNKNIALIERPEHKRRWSTEPWEEMEERALREWLLDRLESYFDVDGRMNDHKKVTAHGEFYQPHLTSEAQVADIARIDKEFIRVAELYAGRIDFDVASLVGDLIAAESVPALPILRYKPTAMDKRFVWERTWDLQRVEDELARQREVAHQVIEKEKVIACAPIAKEIAAETELWKRFHAAEEVFKEKYFKDQTPAHSLSLEDDYQLNSPRATAEGRTAATELGKLRQKAKEFTAQVDVRRDKLIAESADVRKAYDALAAIPADPEIAVPPKYTIADFQSSNFWRLRGKLDVPKERWVSFPHCEGEDGTLVIAWAGYDHLQLARAIAERYELAKEREGRKLVPLLTAIGQLIPWLKQWHNELDPAFGMRMGDYFENYLAEEAKALGTSVEQVMAWTPPEKAKRMVRKKKVGTP